MKVFTTKDFAGSVKEGMNFSEDNVIAAEKAHEKATRIAGNAENKSRNS